MFYTNTRSPVKSTYPRLTDKAFRSADTWQEPRSGLAVTEPAAHFRALATPAWPPTPVIVRRSGGLYGAAGDGAGSGSAASERLAVSVKYAVVSVAAANGT